METKRSSSIVSHPGVPAMSNKKMPGSYIEYPDPKRTSSQGQAIAGPTQCFSDPGISSYSTWQSA